MLDHGTPGRAIAMITFIEVKSIKGLEEGKLYIIDMNGNILEEIKIIKCHITHSYKDKS